MARNVRTPVALRKLQGTDRPDRPENIEGSPEFEPIPLMPRPPVWMVNKWALDEWHTLGPVLLQVGLLTKANLTTFAQLCATHGDLATIYEQNGSPVPAKVTAYRTLVSEFGLTPASASKVRAADPVKPGNKFRGNGKPPNR